MRGEVRLSEPGRVRLNLRRSHPGFFGVVMVATIVGVWDGLGFILLPNQARTLPEGYVVLAWLPGGLTAFGAVLIALSLVVWAGLAWDWRLFRRVLPLGVGVWLGYAAAIVAAWFVTGTVYPALPSKMLAMAGLYVLASREPGINPASGKV